MTPRDPDEVLTPAHHCSPTELPVGRSMRLILSLFLVSMSLAGLGCSVRPDTDEFPERSELTVDCLDLSLIRATAAQPAKVSLFFSVNDCQGNPIVGLSEEHFSISEDGREVSQFESQAQIQPRSLFFRANVALLIDVSGSMQASGSMRGLKRAATAFVASLLGDTEARGYNRVGVFAFDGRPDLVTLVDFTNDRMALERGINSLDTTGRDSSTNLHGALINGLSQLQREEERNRNIDVQIGGLVVFTDGTDQASRVSAAAALSRVQEDVNSEEHDRFAFSVGLGGEVDEEFLRDVGVHGFEWATEISDVTEAFERIAARIRDRTHGYYLLEYCTPKRAGTHQLHLELISGGSADALASGSFDASGFGPGCVVGRVEPTRASQQVSCQIVPASDDHAFLWFALFLVSCLLTMRRRDFYRPKGPRI